MSQNFIVVFVMFRIMHLYLYVYKLLELKQLKK